MPEINDSKIFFGLTIIFSSLKYAKNKNPKATIAKRKLRDAKGDPLSTITFPVIKADDHSITKQKDKNCNIRIILYIF